MPLTTSPFPYFLFLVVPLVIVGALLVTLVLFFRWYFHRFHKNKTATIFGFIVIVLPVLAVIILTLLSNRRHTQLVEIVEVQCNNKRIVPGVVIAKNLKSGKNVRFLLPTNLREEGKIVLLDRSGKRVDSWYNSAFCYQKEIFDTEIKSRTFWVTSNGYGRIIEWKEN